MTSLAERLNDALPQTQCTRCGYPSCREYAQAMANSTAAINRCPPGGQEGIVRLARITGLPPLPLDETCGVEGPRSVAWIVEAHCIGCTLCIKACPVDCIVGAPKRMHTIIESDCTGCELCIPVCPVDCIALDVVTPARAGWNAWSPELANQARRHHEARQARIAPLAQRRDALHAREGASVLQDIESHTSLTDASAVDRKRQRVAEALARAQRRRQGASR